ncbi:BLOC-3 complex member HPS4 [Pelodytes ibericus]
MASTDCMELRQSSWLNYFFLYDGSKVMGEGDPTRAGIKYFYPPETIIDQQELLCGQIAGVVRCMTEVIKFPPKLIRLRKMKFAIMVRGDYLWALGCSVEVTDMSCTQYLEDLIGLFRFYNGPIWRAYKVRPQNELRDDWSIYIGHIQNNTTDLHRVFNSLSHVDKTKVDPLLLLKATLILQSCQRFPHILAGCIMYNNRIVSTQLPPPLTSKILMERVDVLQRPASSIFSFHSLDTDLPDDVCMIPVYIMEKEAIALRHYPAQWMARITTSSSSRRTSSISQSLIDEEPVDHTVLEELAKEKEIENMAPPLVNFQASVEPSVTHGTREDLDVADTATQTLLPCPVSDTPMQSSSPLKDVNQYEQADEADQATITGDSLQNVDLVDSSDNLLLTVSEENETPPISECDQERSENLSIRSFVTCNSTTELDKSSLDYSESSSMEDSQDTSRQSIAVYPHNSSTICTEKHAEGDDQAGLTISLENVDDMRDTTEGDTGSHEQDTGTSYVPSPSSDSIDLNLSAKNSSLTDWTLTLDSSPSNSSTKLVQMILYVHNVKGLVLSLMAEWPFKFDRAVIQDVYDSTLASLNGLEVHLKETMPANNNAAKATYSFTHYDAIQNVLTANLPSISSSKDCHFLRAANLIHSDFNQHKSFQEMTVRNASTAVFGCQSTVHQTYFQQIAPPFRNSGVPDPQDSAFTLPGKAKQKLLKHGLNLL